MSSPRRYPAELAEWWRREACRHFDWESPDSLPTPILHATTALRSLFTDRRPREFSDYGREISMLLAYGLYYFPRSFVMTRLVLDELQRMAGWRPKHSGVRILDVGAGTGAAGFAALEMLRAVGNAEAFGGVEVHRIDHSPTALRMAESLQSEIYPETRSSSEAQNLMLWADKPSGGPGYDLILVTLVLNEIPDHRAFLEKLMVRLREGGVLVCIEPGQPVSSWNLAVLAHSLVSEGLAGGVLPLPGCLAKSAAQPRPDERYWPHDVRAWEPPPEVSRLDQFLGHTEPELKFSFIALHRPQDVSPVPDSVQMLHRLVSPLLLKPGHLLFHTIDAEGARWHIEWSTRGMRRSEVKALAREFERGDLLRLPGLEPLKLPAHGRITTPSGLERIHHPD